jgi:protein-L-isoaspartate(D-aspartate) O-methyltransferase
VLDPRSELTLSLPTDREVDAQALLEALAEQPAVRRTGATPTVGQVFDGLTLWLAIREPRWCALSEVAGRGSPLLRDAPLTAPESVATAGLLADDGIALLGTADGELTVLCHGNEAVADDLLAHVESWEAAGRPGTDGLRIDAYPAGVPAGTGDFVLEKGKCLLALSW